MYAYPVQLLSFSTFRYQQQDKLSKQTVIQSCGLSNNDVFVPVTILTVPGKTKLVYVKLAKSEGWKQRAKHLVEMDMKCCMLF